RDRRDDRRRPRLDERPVLRLRGVDRRRLPLRRRVGLRDRVRYLLDHHRDLRAAGALQPLQRRGTGMRRGRREQRGATLAIGQSRGGAFGLGMAAWVIGLVWIFPIVWPLLTSFKSEQDAAAQTFHDGLSLARYSDVSH